VCVGLKRYVGRRAKVNESQVTPTGIVYGGAR